MDAAQDIPAIPDLALDQGHMVLSVQAVHKTVGPETAVFCGQVHLRHPVDQNVMALAVVLELPDADKGNAPFFRQGLQLGRAHHGAVLAHDLAAKAAGTKARQAAQVHRRFRMSVPLQDPVGLCEQGEHVPRPAEILRPGVILHAGDGGHGPLLGRDARRRRHMVDGDGKSRFMVVRIIPHHLRDLEALHIFLRHGHTDQPPAVYGHEIDILCRRELSRTDKVPLVLPVRIIHDQNDLSVPQILQRLFDSLKLIHFSTSPFFSVEIF